MTMTPQQLQRSWLEYLAERPNVEAVDFETGLADVRIKPLRGEAEIFHVYSDAELLPKAYSSLTDRAQQIAQGEDITASVWWYLNFYMNESIQLDPISRYFVLSADGEGFEPDPTKPRHPTRSEQKNPTPERQFQGPWEPKYPDEPVSNS